MTEETKITFCPNCSQPAVRQGDEVVCEKCDAVFKITRKEAKVKELGRIESIEQRLSKVEALLPTDPEPEPEPAPEDDDDEESEDIL